MLIVDQQNRSAEEYCFNLYGIFVWFNSFIYLLSVLNPPLDEDLKTSPYKWQMGSKLWFLIDT